MKQGMLLGLAMGLGAAVIMWRVVGGLIGADEPLAVAGQGSAANTMPAQAVVSQDWASGAAMAVSDAPPAGDPYAPPMDGGGGWLSEGLCAPAPVNADLIRMVFDPNLVAAPEGAQAPLLVEQGADRVVFGDYVVTLDTGARVVTVTGPEGAEVLKRDIDVCVGLGVETGAGESGVWRWSDAAGAWRYVNELLEPMPLPGAAPDGNA